MTAPLTRERSFKIRPSGPLHRNAPQPTVQEDFSFAPDPSDREIVQQLTLRRLQRTLTSNQLLQQAEEKKKPAPPRKPSFSDEDEEDRAGAGAAEVPRRGGELSPRLKMQVPLLVPPRVSKVRKLSEDDLQIEEEEEDVSDEEEEPEEPEELKPKPLPLLKRARELKIPTGEGLPPAKSQPQQQQQQQQQPQQQPLPPQGKEGGEQGEGEKDKEKEARREQGEGELSAEPAREPEHSPHPNGSHHHYLHAQDPELRKPKRGQSHGRLDIPRPSQANARKGSLMGSEAMGPRPKKSPVLEEQQHQQQHSKEEDGPLGKKPPKNLTVTTIEPVSTLLRKAEAALTPGGSSPNSPNSSPNSPSNTLRRSHHDGRPSSLSDPNDLDGELKQKYNRVKRAQSTPSPLSHSIRFELDAMASKEDMEFIPFDDLKRRQSTNPLAMSHPHNYSKWLRKWQPDNLHDEEMEEEEEDQVREEEAGGGEEEHTSTEGQGEVTSSLEEEGPTTEENSQASLRKDLSLHSERGLHTSPHRGPQPHSRSQRPAPKLKDSAHSSLEKDQSSRSPFGVLTQQASALFSQRRMSKKSPIKKRRSVAPEDNTLFAWNHYSLQTAIVGVNLVALIIAFVILIAVSSSSAIHLSNQAARFLEETASNYASETLSGLFTSITQQLTSLEDSITLPAWSLKTNPIQLEHTLLITSNQGPGVVDGLFYAEPENGYLSLQRVSNKTEIFGKTLNSSITFYSMNPSCPLGNSSCTPLGSPLTSPAPFSIDSQPWNAIEPGPFLTEAYPLFNGSLGITLSVSALDPVDLDHARFIVGADLELVTLSGLLAEIRLGIFNQQDIRASLLLFLLSPEGYLLGVSLENPEDYLTEPGCSICRVKAIESISDEIRLVTQAYYEITGNYQEALPHFEAHGYSTQTRLLPFGQQKLLLVISVESGATIMEGQLAQYVVIPVIFLLLFLFILFSVLVITRRLTNSVNKVSKMMLDMANLDIASKPSNLEVGASHLKETERLVTAMEIMDVALRSFVKYVPQEVVKILLQENAEVVIGVDDSFLTILFSDIEGFTSISEALEPSDLIQMMSEYLDEMSQIILDSGGVVDKYIGDAIMAFWNAPIPVPSHRAVACAVALRSQRRLNRLNSEWASKGIPKIRSRIGLNAGMALVGNLGSDQRMSYTCIGDCVNTASRLEGLNKLYGTYIMISENILQAQTVQENFLTRPLDYVCVKGKTQPLMVYELICELKMANGDMIAQINTFKEGFEYYRRGDFKNAEKKLSQYARINTDDKAAETLRKRIKEFQTVSPPPPDWDGSYVAVEK